jgi:transcriptional regulator with XRE-family HTH domain
MRPTRLRLARLDADLIQLLLAQRVHMAPSRYSVIERGLAEPSPDERRRLAAALGKTEEDLFGQGGMGSQATTR